MRRAMMILLACAAMLLPLTAVAADPPAHHEQHTATVTTDDGHHYRVHLVQGESLTVKDLDSGEQVCDLNLRELREELEDAVAEAVRGAGEALSELRGTALAITLGDDDNEIRVSHDGQDTVVDLDAVFQGLKTALRSLGEVAPVRREQASNRQVAALQQQVQQLQQQIDAMEKELRGVRRRARH